jgi:hypothetical protein
MTKKLNQILAIESVTKKRAEDTFTKSYQEVQKVELVTGFSRNYQPKDDTGERLPSETKKVQVRAVDAVKAVKQGLAELIDITATKDATNQEATANVVVDGVTLAKDVPATTLLFLEKRLVAIIDFVKKLPVLAADESWSFDSAQGLFRTEPVTTVRTKKVEDFRVIVPATKEHPAQVTKVTEDQLVGEWRNTKTSGALPVDERASLLARAERLQKALKEARQEANETPVKPVEVGEKLLSFVFGA